MRTPLVSVITTVFNGEGYFHRAIPSILAQTLSDFEYILVDDGSTDATWEQLCALASTDPRIRVFSVGRLGRANALNYAIEQAHGQYIAQQDFDDISTPIRLERQVELLESNPSLGVVGGYYLLHDEIRQERYVRKPPIEHSAILQAMARYIPFAHTITTFRKASWRQAGGYPSESVNLIDLRLWLQIAETPWQFANIPEVLGEHFVHETSFWHRSFTYRYRQIDLAHVQAQAIRQLHLPAWMYVYPLGRYLYCRCPHGIKRALRRTLGRSEESDR